MMLMAYRRWIAALALVAAACGMVHADEVLLKDGSRLMGDVTRVAAGKVMLTTDFAGDLPIDLAKVQGIRTDEKVMVGFESGERVAGRLTYTDEAGQRLTDTTFGDTDFELSQVNMAWQPDAQPPDVAKVEQEYEQKLAETQAEAQKQVAEAKQAAATQVEAAQTRAEQLEPVWTLSLFAGLNGQTGNSERFAFNGGVEALRETPGDRLDLWLQGRFAQDNGDRTQNEILGGAKLEVDVSEKWFVWGRGELEFDEFENLDLRSTVSAGVGYWFIEEDDHEFKGRAGLGYVHESFDNGVTEDRGVVELGIDYLIDINPLLQFTHSSTVYPALDELENTRYVAETAAEIPLTDEKNWKLRLGVRNDFDANPEPGVESLDTYFFANVVFDLIK